MSLEAGTKLGPYEILAPLGRGGMGEVYRAKDTRLQREVAIKVSNAEFTERFAREARSIAALNHTNVCHLYDVGPNYLVLEYVEGETLRGPLSFEEALPILRQLIDGIEAAHEKNIIHRDLKPANIKITPEGVVKILDFGLAKAADPETTSGDPENSPTLTMGSTQAGAILGTAAYMPPEQAKGKKADRRSDIWSFGVVVYELLTGQKPFGGETVVEILGGVINKEPDWSQVPPRAERLVRWCLEKDRKNRLASISDARMLLNEPESPAPAPPVMAGARAASSKIPWVAASLAVIAALSGWGMWWNATRPVASPLTRFNVDLGPDARRGSRITAVLSPDGTRIVFTGNGQRNGTARLFTRRLDQAAATPLAGTEFQIVSTPFFSPDGEWIGFMNGQRLMKVAAQGGSAVTIGETPIAAVGASWGADGNIILGSLNGLLRVPAAGGVAQPLMKTVGPEGFPQVLPGGRAVLFNSAETNPGSLEDLDITVLRFDTGEKKVLLHGGYWPRYLPTSGKTGHLVYMHEGTLFGVAFDPQKLEMHGSPVPLLEDVAAGTGVANGGGQFAFSNTGTFVYLSGRVEGASTYPAWWLDATGKTTPLMAQPGPYAAPRLSPDGKRLAYTAAGTKAGEVWVYDSERDTPTQLTFNGPGLRELAWGPDSKHLVFGDGSSVWWIRADGSGQPRKLLDSTNPRPYSFTPNGRLAVSSAGSGLPDISTVAVDLSDPENPKPGKLEPFLTEPRVVEVDPAFSPDGKFLAYVSNESGTEEVFVRPFPGPGGKWKISTEGGKFPAFSRATRELFFLGGDDRIWVVNYTIQGDSFSNAKPRVWSPAQIRRDGTRQSFDISADGKRAVIFPRTAAEEAQGSLHATFLLNFFDEVRRRIP